MEAIVCDNCKEIVQESSWIHLEAPPESWGEVQFDPANRYAGAARNQFDFGSEKCLLEFMDNRRKVI